VTVAAVILVPEPAAALALADGEPVLRRVCQAAWSGGAIPTVAVGSQLTEEARDAVGDLTVTFAEPAATEPHGIAWFARGLLTAATTVTDTTAALLWPVRQAWVDPETVTSLVEAHGAWTDAIIRPAYAGQPGFPILIPAALADRLAALSGQHGVEAVEALVAAGVPLRQIEMGDPGIVHDISTPRADLPSYQGPPQPAAGPPPDWNEALARSANPPA